MTYAEFKSHMDAGETEQLTVCENWKDYSMRYLREMDIRAKAVQKEIYGQLSISKIDDPQSRVAPQE